MLARWAGNDRGVRLWDTRRRRPIGTLAGHDGSVWAVAFPRRARTLVGADSDGTIGIWDTDVDNSAGRIRRALGTPADHTP
ncbi:hypothetical protein ACFZBU_18485 [Embleya sp. NPDC008237]|uniref:hypothetical protein n=1 Tax=Embleya sp. NPDC008237 TaxID=3363978 RepID=UPI0036EC1AA4